MIPSRTGRRGEYGHYEWKILVGKIHCIAGKDRNPFLLAESLLFFSDCGVSSERGVFLNSTESVRVGGGGKEKGRVGLERYL